MNWNSSHHLTFTDTTMPNGPSKCLKGISFPSSLVLTTLSPSMNVTASPYRPFLPWTFFINPTLPPRYLPMPTIAGLSTISECHFDCLAVQYRFTSNTLAAKHGANTPQFVGTSALPPNTILHTSFSSRLCAPPASQTPSTLIINTLHNPQSLLHMPVSKHFET